MKQTLAMNEAWIGRFRGEPAAVAALAVFALSSATLAGAWYFQLVLKILPCPLCLEQRISHYVVVPLSLLMAIAALVRAPQKLLTVGFVAIVVAALCGAALAAYHAGVEWHFWAGPTDCSGPLSDLTAKGSLLDQLRSVNVVALRHSVVALPRHLARRLQRTDLAHAGGDCCLRRARTQANRLIGRPASDLWRPPQQMDLGRSSTSAKA